MERRKKINPWENEFARWLLLLPAHEDEHLTHTLEDIAMKQRSNVTEGNPQMGKYESEQFFPSRI
jgi:hypothetical protein